MNLKKILIFILTLFILLGIGLVLFINPILEKAKPKLLDAASTALKNPVSAEKIGVSLFPTTGFVLSDVKIGKAPKDISVGKVEIDISILDAFKGIVSLKKAKIENITLHGEILENGKFELDGLPKSSETDVAVDTEDRASEPVTEISQSEKNSGLNIAIEDLLVKNLVIEVLNQKTKKTIVTKVEQTSFSKDGEKGRLSLDATLGKGKIGFNGHMPSYKIDPKEIRVDGVFTASFSDINDVFDFLGIDRNKIDLAKLDLRADISMPSKDVVAIELDNLSGDYFDQTFIVNGKMKNALSGDGVLNLKIPNLNLEKLAKIDDKLKVYSGELKNIECEIEIFQKKEFSPKCKIAESLINDVKFALNDLRASYNLEAKSYKLQNLELNLAEGVFNLTGDGMVEGKTHLDLNANGLDILQLMKLSGGKDKTSAVGGKIANLKSTLDLSGSSKNGSFSVEIAPFSIQGFNIFKKVSDALATIPGLSLSVVDLVPEGYAAILVSENSEFQNIKVSGKVQNSKIILSEIRANSTGYYLLGQGVINDGEIDLDMSFIMDAQLVAEIEKKNPKVASIKNPDGQIVVPVTIKKGKDGLPILLPDMKNLLKQQIGVQLKNNAKKGLEKISPGLGGLVDGLLN